MKIPAVFRRVIQKMLERIRIGFRPAAVADMHPQSLPLFRRLFRTDDLNVVTQDRERQHIAIRHAVEQLRRMHKPVERRNRTARFGEPERGLVVELILIRQPEGLLLIEKRDEQKIVSVMGKKAPVREFGNNLSAVPGI